MIKLIKSYPYDNNYEYIKLYSSKSEQNNFFNQFQYLLINEGAEEGYTREGNSFIIDFNYDFLVSEGVNYVIWNNGFKDLYCFITNKEYVDEECTQIFYEIDVINTYLFDFSVKKSFVERKKCTLSELTEYDEGIEIGEHIIESDTKVIDKSLKLFAMFSGFKDYYVNKDKNDFKEFNLSSATRKGTTIDGIRYPLSFFALDTSDFISNFYTYLIDHPSLVGIIALPNCTYTTTDFYIPMIKIENGEIIKSGIGTQNLVNTITSVPVNGGSVSVSKGDITDMFPYTYYMLTDNETEPLLLKPQYCSDNIQVNGKFALSHTPVERYYPSYYKGDTSGKVYNITNTSVLSLPIGSNGGLETLQANANQFEQNKKTMLGNVLTGVVATGVGLATGGVGLAVGASIGLSQGMSSVNTIKDNIARNKDLELYPSSIKSYGTPSTRYLFGTNNVRVVKYTIQDKYKNRLRNYIDRYGNKYNNYATIDLKSYKGFIKFNGVDIDTKIDNIYTNKIISILERGIFIE